MADEYDKRIETAIKLPQTERGRTERGSRQGGKISKTIDSRPETTVKTERENNLIEPDQEFFSTTNNLRPPPVMNFGTGH